MPDTETVFKRLKMDSLVSLGPSRSRGEMKVSVPQLEFNLCILFVEDKAPVIREDAVRPLVLALVEYHDATQFSVAIAVRHEDQASTDLSKFSGFENRTTSRSRLEELNEIASGLVFNGGQEPSRNGGREKAKKEIRHEELHRADSRPAQRAQFTVGAEAPDRQDDADEKGQGDRIGECDGKYGLDDDAQVGYRDADQEELVEASKQILGQQDERQEAKRQGTIDEGLAHHVEGEGARDSHGPYPIGRTTARRGVHTFLMVPVNRSTVTGDRTETSALAQPTAAFSADMRDANSTTGGKSGSMNRALRNAERILVIRLGSLGDVIRTLPAVKGLRSSYPGVHLTWLVEPAAAGVVEAAACVDESIIFPRNDLVEFLGAADGMSFAKSLAQFVARLRDRRFDLVLDFHGILKSGLLARLAGAPIRYGFDRSGAKEFSETFVNHRIPLPSVRVSRYERNAMLVGAVAPAASIPDKPFLAPSPLAVARLTARLRVSARDGASGFVLIHPGTSPGAVHKRYPALAWAEVARRLASVGIEVWIAASGVARERALVDEVIRLADGSLVAAPEGRAFDDLLALLTRASVFVSSDSGPLHAASLVGIPVVQILGPTDPYQNQPWPGSPSRRAHVPIPCSPCRRGCLDPACMRAIPPSIVVEKIVELLAGENDARAGSQGSLE